MPLDRGSPALRDGSDATNEASDEVDALLHLEGLPRAPASPHKKAPQFMLDLFNAVAVHDGSPKSQKDILEGNIVRSFEDKGKTCPYELLVFCDCLFWKCVG